jgi:ABC-2 type transport system permease protein
MGVFFSTLTDSAVGAAGATMFVAIVSQILDGLSILHAIHPYLLSHDWLAFSDLFRSPVLWTGMIHGLVRTAIYTAVFLGLAVWRFRRRDVTS